MVDDKKPMQADGGDSVQRGDPSSAGHGGAGESGGGPYPNPHSGKTPKHGVLGHGGQTEIDQKPSDGGADRGQE